MASVEGEGLDLPELLAVTALSKGAMLGKYHSMPPVPGRADKIQPWGVGQSCEITGGNGKNNGVSPSPVPNPPRGIHV